MSDAPVVDVAITRAQQRQLTMQTVLWTMAASTLFVPSAEDPGEDFANFRPVYFPKDGSEMLAVYSTPEAANGVAQLAPWMVTLTGSQIVRMMPRDKGLVLNPGSAQGFDIEPDGLRILREELSA
jgi:hypothetical protein